MTSNEKNSKLQSCRSRWELQFSYKNHLRPSSYEKDMIFLKSDVVTPAGVAWQGCTVTPVGVAWQAWYMEYALAGTRANVAHFVTPMHVARQSVFVAPRGPARPKGLDLQIFVRVDYF